MPDFVTSLTADFTLTGDLSVDAPAFLRHHGLAGIADHVERVAAQAGQIADRVGVDRAAALTAAWLHDISLVLPAVEMLSAAESAGLELLPAERQAPGMLHGKLSAIFAQQFFAVTDPQVLAAMRCHTTLRAGATLLDRVLFAADKLSWDPEHAPYRHEMAAALDESLNRAVWCFLDWGWQRRGQMAVIHPWFRAAYVEMARQFAPVRRD
ncbi:MAG: putative superfamily hydrolase of metabolism [Firmicutes bacterium]|nr:putative superfamily hydrolase of metabolism [Bacillota bacterium]